MEIAAFSEIFNQLNDDKVNGRDHVLRLASALIEWMGFPYAENGKPRLLDFQTLKLKDALAPAPITGQEQLYRLTAEGLPIRVRFAVLKKYDKKIIHYLVDNNVGLASYQAGMRGIRQIEGREPYVSQQPYFLHFITTTRYDRLWVIFNEGEQKRVLVFRNRLTQTQFNKILPAWHNIAARPKPEMAKLFWSSLDVKEVNKDFYKHIKEQFDALVGIAKTQTPDVDENTIKQFAVRLIGRYIFCWFLKEKEIVPERLISSKTIDEHRDIYFQKFLTKLFFNTLNAEVTDPSRVETITELDTLYKNIPYLNGGLFEWHTEDFLFKKIDLNAWLITFVKVLEGFDFTVDESSSLYQLVSIDPEMLGRIFENLLASQNPDTEKMANQRKAYGAFYTPREIVDYMVNESLKAYLETQLLPQLPEGVGMVNEPQAELKGTLFQNLVAEEPRVDYDKARAAEIERKRERIKIKTEKFFANDCTENPFDKEETIQVRKALSEITVLDPACGSGAFPMGVMLRLMELRQIVGHGHRNNYDLKEEILSKNIFGVDIMPMAVEIARLRAWLSLVLEADYKPTDRKNNFGIAALPNLDFKFVCANSLIDSGYDSFVTKLDKTKGYYDVYFDLENEIKKLERLRNEYFDPKGDKAKKTELQKRFVATKSWIKERFGKFKDNKNYDLKDFLSKVDDWNPFDDSHPSSFFSPSWMFGINRGFDVVIGNPPYGAKFTGSEKQFFKTNYKHQNYQPESFLFFSEKSFDLVKDKAIVSFIIPNTWLTNLKLVNIRKFLTGNNLILNIAHYHKSVFNAVVDTEVVIFRKGFIPNNCIKVFNHFDANQLQELTHNQDNWKEKNGEVINIFTNERVEKIIEKLKTNSNVLNFYCDLYSGAKPYEVGKGTPPQTKEMLTKRIYDSTRKLNTSYKKVIRGSDINKYENNWNGTRWIKYGSNLAAPRKAEIFSNIKIIIRQTGDSLIATYDEDGFICLNNTHVINQKVGTDLKYILALINSSLLNFYFQYLNPETGEALAEVKKETVEKLLIKKAKEEMRFVKIVEKILSAKAQNQDTTELEKEIDVLVYKLYELSYDEVLIIDPDFWLSKHDYDM